MKVKNEVAQNLLTLKPKRALQWEMNEGDRVVLIVPKFKHPLLVKWFVPLLAKPNIRVKFDPLGSFVWRRCDGHTSVEQIGQEMAKAFGEPVEPLYERIGLFLSKLAKDKFVELEA